MIVERDISDVSTRLAGVPYGYLTVNQLFVKGDQMGLRQFTLDDNIVRAVVKIMEYYRINDIQINSTYRTVEYNKRLSERGYNASLNSLHTKGKAIDFSFVASKYGDNRKFQNKPDILLTMFKLDINKNALIKQQLAALGVNEFVFGSNYVHIGIDSYPSITDYSNEKNEVSKQVDEDDKNRRKILPTSEYYEYMHYDSSITTVWELMNTDNTIISTNDIEEQKFLEYENKDGVKNLDRLWERYTVAQKISFSNEYSILNSRYKTASVSDKPDIKKQMDAVRLSYNSSLPINVGTLLYIPKNKCNVEVLIAEGKGLFMRQQNLSTFMYKEFWALSNDPSYVPIKQLAIEGSKYSINYLHLTFNCWIYVRSLNKILNVTPFVRNMTTNVTEYGGDFNIVLNDIQGDISEANKYSETYYAYVQKVRDMKFDISFFHKYIQQNDIVFLRYERLDIENDSDDNANDTEVLPPSLPGKVYDMIGLVDITSETYSSDANLSVITVMGRDFTKMLVEDSSVFFPLALMNNTHEFFLNYDESDGVFKRLWGSGDYFNKFVYTYRSIRDTLGFLFNRITHTGVLPKDSELFDSYRNSYNWATREYTDNTSKTYEVNGASDEYLKDVEQNGVWRIIKVVVDNQLDERRLQNGELSNPEGTIYDLVKRVCLDPFVEFWGDTFGDQYVFIARQPPFTLEQITQYFEDNVVISINADVVSNVNLNWDDTYYTYFQVQPLESVLGGYQYVALARIPIVYFEEFAQVFGLHKRVVSDNYIPQSYLSGKNSKSDTDVFRDAVANDLQFLIESSVTLPFTRKGMITIVGGDRRIKRGMWVRFKPTDEIYYVKSVINSVSLNGNDINRETVLTVERGMVERFVLGSSGIEMNGKNVNYFNIVDTKVIKDLLQVQISEDGSKASSSTASNVKLVEEKLFDFFMRRKQFDK